MLKIIFILLTILTFQLNAKSIDIKKFYQENLEAHSYCSAIYYVKTALPKGQKKLTEVYQSYGEFFQYISSLYFKELTNKTASRGKINSIREIYLELLEKQYRKTNTLSKHAFMKYGQCERLLIDFSKNLNLYKEIEVSANNKKQRQKLLLNDLALTNKKPTNIDKKQILESLNIWINDYNAMTPVKIKQMLNDKIKQGK